MWMMWVIYPCTIISSTTQKMIDSFNSMMSNLKRFEGLPFFFVAPNSKSASLTKELGTSFYRDNYASNRCFFFSKRKYAFYLPVELLCDPSNIGTSIEYLVQTAERLRE